MLHHLLNGLAGRDQPDNDDVAVIDQFLLRASSLMQAGTAGGYNGPCLQPSWQGN